MSKQISILFIGCKGVGKNSFLSRWCDQEMQDQDKINSAGLTFFLKKLIIHNIKYKVKVFYMLGQERMHRIIPKMTSGFDGIAFLYDVSSKNSFDMFPGWCEGMNYEHPIIFIGNKSDLEEEVNQEEVNALAHRINAKLFFTSTKTGENIDTAMNSLINDIINDPNPVQRNERNHREQTNCYG